MADITEEQLLQWMIKDPTWCMFYHRNQVMKMLPTLAKSHFIITNIEKRLARQQELLNIEERGDRS